VVNKIGMLTRDGDGGVAGPSRAHSDGPASHLLHREKEAARLTIYRSESDPEISEINSSICWDIPFLWRSEGHRFSF